MKKLFIKIISKFLIWFLSKIQKFIYETTNEVFIIFNIHNNLKEIDIKNNLNKSYNLYDYLCDISEDQIY